MDEATATPAPKTKKPSFAQIAILTPIAVGIFYLLMSHAHVKNVETAFDYKLKSYSDIAKVESVDVPWLMPFSETPYECKAKVQTKAGKTLEVSFKAAKAGADDLLKDDWDVNLGFWGWIGDDYRVTDVAVVK